VTADDYRREAALLATTRRGLSSELERSTGVRNPTRADFAALALDHYKADSARAFREAMTSNTGASFLVAFGLLRAFGVRHEELDEPFTEDRAVFRMARVCRRGGAMRDFRRPPSQAIMDSGMLLPPPALASVVVTVDGAGIIEAGIVVAVEPLADDYLVRTIEAERRPSERRTIIVQREREWSPASTGIRWAVRSRNRVDIGAPLGASLFQSDTWPMRNAADRKGTTDANHSM
jgi:hypothetical protein